MNKFYRVSENNPDNFEMQISHTAFLQFDRRHLELPLVQNISIDLKHKFNSLWKLKSFKHSKNCRNLH